MTVGDVVRHIDVPRIEEDRKSDTPRANTVPTDLLNHSSSHLHSVLTCDMYNLAAPP